MTSWPCQAQLPENLTVGQKYFVECSGGDVAWSKEDLHVIVPEAQKFQLKVLSISEISNNKIKFVAVSHQAGEFTFDKIGLKDKIDTPGIELGAWSIKVDSVIKGKPEPFGPFGPFLMSWPLWLWIFLTFVFLTIAGFLAWAYQLKKRRLAWAEIVNQNSTSLLPYHQFYKDMRKILRSQEEEKVRLKKIEETFRLYFLRELKVPTIEQEPKWIFSHLHKRDAQAARKVKDDFLQVFREIRRAQESKQSFQNKDTEQISHSCQRVVDLVNEAIGAKS